MFKKLYTMAIDYERYRAGLERKTIQLGFGNIVYLENNIKSEMTIILLHGFGANKDTWNRFVKELNNQYHIIVLDLPGHGESISTDDLRYTLEHYAEMLHSFLKAKRVDNIHLIGNSMGGAIALCYNDMYEGVNTLTLIDALGMVKTKSELGLLIDETGENPLLNACTKKSYKQLLQTGMQKPPYIPSIFLEILISEKCDRAAIEKIIYDEIFMDADLHDIAKRVNIPTLILWGKYDKVLHVDNATLFNQTIQDSQLVIFEKLGHVPMLEDAKKTARVVLSFISKFRSNP